MAVIISDNRVKNWSRTLCEAVLHTGTQVIRFAANRLDIKPCTACGSCSSKTFGRCVIQDDMQKILPKIAGCRALVLISPVIFGGVGHHIKKVMDRMCALGDPRYYMNNGEIVKGMSGQRMNYYMVGVGDKLSEAERSAFFALYEENRIIMNVEGIAFILDSRTNNTLIEAIAKKIAHV
ncbi:MAG: flavodoxin family protein [Clostridiaceae bacterium]|nr:flavodoxin family protein [Clostridiaceae bacterium]